MNVTNFFAKTDIVVIDTNPECADFDNPRGNIYGFASYVVAEDEHGNRVQQYVKTMPVGYGEKEAIASASAMAEALNVRLKNGKLPVNFKAWEETFPAYGSAAFSNEEMVEWERSLEDEYYK